jgi:hypothetical protein
MTGQLSWPAGLDAGVVAADGPGTVSGIIHGRYRRYAHTRLYGRDRPGTPAPAARARNEPPSTLPGFSAALNAFGLDTS